MSNHDHRDRLVPSETVRLFECPDCGTRWATLFPFSGRNACPDCKRPAPTRCGPSSPWYSYEGPAMFGYGPDTNVYRTAAADRVDTGTRLVSEESLRRQQFTSGCLVLLLAVLSIALILCLAL